jgi:hypothetical protein
LQEKLIRAGFFVDPEGVFKSIEEFWDGEIWTTVWDWEELSYGTWPKRTCTWKNKFVRSVRVLGTPIIINCHFFFQFVTLPAPKPHQIPIFHCRFHAFVTRELHAPSMVADSPLRFADKPWLKLLLGKITVSLIYCERKILYHDWEKNIIPWLISSSKQAG